jgi:ribosomal silencing factor RsfS
MKTKTRIAKTLMKVDGKLVETDRVVITISINKEIPLAVFEDMVQSCKAAMWEYIQDRGAKDEEWKEVSAID